MNWENVEKYACTDCKKNSWTLFYEKAYEDDPDISDDSEVEVAHFECKNCGSHGRIFAEGNSIIRTGAMRGDTEERTVL